MADRTNKSARVSASTEKIPPTPLEAAAKKIETAWFAGFISAGITLVFILISFGGTSIAGVDAWAFIDVAIMLSLSYGVYRKSRACAIILLAFFVLNKLMMWVTAGNISGFPLALVFMWFFSQGVVGTFQHHKLVNNGDAAA